MKIAIPGGTGSLGEGLALRWAAKHDIIVGSRQCEKAESIAEDYTCRLTDSRIKCRMKGCLNHDAVENADMVVITIKYNYVRSTLGALKTCFTDQIVISPIVPMSKVGDSRFYLRMTYEYSKDL